MRSIHILKSNFSKHTIVDHCRNTFGTWEVKKVHGDVARSTFNFEVKLQTTWRLLHVQSTFCLDLVKRESNVWVLYHFQKRRQAWYVWRGSAKMHVAWQAQYMRHLHRRYEVTEHISLEVLHFGASGLKVSYGFLIDDFAWEAQHFAWPGVIFSWQSQYTLERWDGKIVIRIGTKLSTFHFWRRSRRIASFLMLSTWKFEEVSQDSFVFDVVKF